MLPADPRSGLDGIELRYVETFLTVLATGNFREAGRRLGYAQPTVSQHIKKLEAAVRTTLVDRRPGGCVPTSAGEILRCHAEPLLRLSRRVFQAVANGQFVIGASSNIGIYLLQPTINAFERLPGAPGVNLVLAPNPEIARRLDDGELDLALMEWWDNRPGFESVPWRCEPLVVIVPPDHAWAGLQGIDLALLSSAPLLGGEPGTGTGRILDEALAASGIELGVTRGLGSTEAVKRAVQAGNGISIVLAATVDQEVRAGLLVALPIADQPLKKTMYAVFRSFTPEAAPARTFLGLLREHTLL